MKRTALLLFILAAPVLADEAAIHVSQTREVSLYMNQGLSIPTSDQQIKQSLAALSSARAASIAASQAWYEWDKGAAAERDIELARIHELMGATAGPSERRP